MTTDYKTVVFQILKAQGFHKGVDYLVNNDPDKMSVKAKTWLRRNEEHVAFQISIAMNKLPQPGKFPALDL